MLKQKVEKIDQVRFEPHSKKDNSHSGDLNSPLGTQSRINNPKKRAKKSKRDQISVDSMIALYILKTAPQPEIKNIGNSN